MPATGPGFGYDETALRAGSSAADLAAGLARRLAAGLSDICLPTAVFGALPVADSLHAAVSAMVVEHAQTAARAGTALQEESSCLARAADLAVAATAATTRLAQALPVDQTPSGAMR